LLVQYDVEAIATIVVFKNALAHDYDVGSGAPGQA
jgi:hypothetical protein